jgi:undecaprenyl diphosphate synthase
MTTLVASSNPQDLLREINPEKIPQHIAIIMDGNGRWAKQRHLPRVFGHRAGITSVREVVRVCGELGVKALTLYAFSAENWARPSTEVSALMRLLEDYLQRELPELHKNKVRLQVIGRWKALPAGARTQLERTIEATSRNKGLILTLALNYGGRQEIVDACNRALQDKVKKVDEAAIARHLDTAGLPDPDLLIRTSGEMRISNFLLWQLAYTEMYITPTSWPEFRRPHLYRAILDFQRRERRFGGL